jgi:hypothetical protein
MQNREHYSPNTGGTIVFFRRGIKAVAFISMLAAALLAGFAIGYFSNPGIIVPENSSQGVERLAETSTPEPVDQAAVPFEAVTREDTNLVFTTENIATGQMETEARIPTKEETGLTQAALAALFPEWHIQSFSIREVNLVRKIYARIETVYVLRAEQGVVAVYRRDVEGNQVEETLIQQTSIRVDMLPRSVQQDLAEGITVSSQEEIEHLMEGWDS